jgi:ABC-type antimicrobial peptide transport system permease subunit
VKRISAIGILSLALGCSLFAAQTGIGVVIGLVAAFVLTRLLSSLLFGVSAVDPITYMSVTLGLLAAAALASYLSSRRAAAIDPAVALRVE